MRYLSSFFLLVAVGCGGSDTSPGEGTPETCTAGESQTIPCESDPSGAQEQVCVDGRWENAGECLEAEGCSEPGSREISCGLNGRGTQAQVCAAQQWENEGACADEDVCVDDEEKLRACALEDAGQRRQVCSGGQWQDVEGCTCPAGQAYDALADACFEPIECDEEAAPFGGGDGTEENPFAICSATQLAAVADHLEAHFVLARSLDLSEVEGFVPLGSELAPFVGVFDGAGRTLLGLNLAREEEDGVGLFRQVGSAAAEGSEGSEDSEGTPGVVRNARLVDFVVVGAVETGALAARVVHAASVVEGVHVIGGQVTGTDYVGGLVGINSGAVRSSSATAPVAGRLHVGGLVGNNSDGRVESSYAIGAVSGSSTGVGGLVGGNPNGTVESSYATGAVEGSLARVGGLVGDNSSGGTVRKSYATGSATAPGNAVGGLVGFNFHGAVQDSYATGAATSLGKYIGGLVGDNLYGSVERCYATGTVTGSENLGALVGYNELGAVNTSFALEQGELNLVGSIMAALAPSRLLTPAELAAQTTFTADDVDWDFTSLWTMSTARPVFRWQTDD